MKQSRKLTRRSLIKGLGVTAGASAVGSIGAHQAYAEPVNADVFCLCGDRWHSFDYIRASLTHSIVDGIGVPVDFSPNYQLLNREHLNNYKALIILMDGMLFPGGYTTPYPMYTPGELELVSDPPVGDDFGGPHVMWIQPEQGAALREWVSAGGSAWFMHNASYISQANEDFRDVQGALFAGHTPFRTFKIRIDNHEHPITQGVNDFVITEEQHFVLYDKAPETVLAHSVNEEGLTFEHGEAGDMGTTAEAVWAYDYGEGRVCFMSPGHTAYTFWNPEFITMQQNAMRWLLRQS